MNTQSIHTDSISTALVTSSDRPSGIRLTATRASETSLPLNPPAELPEPLRASQVEAVAADEIDWLYENVDDETDPDCVHARAHIEGWLGKLSLEHKAAIALHFDPTPWPEELPGHGEDSFALILHTLCPSSPRDLLCYSPAQLERRARRRLEIRLESEGPRALTGLIRRARWKFAEAVRAYAKARGRVPSVVARGAACN
jgi:hypothetical protein